jgi:hypothetical protein
MTSHPDINENFRIPPSPIFSMTKEGTSILGALTCYYTWHIRSLCDTPTAIGHDCPKPTKSETLIKSITCHITVALTLWTEFSMTFLFKNLIMLCTSDSLKLSFSGFTTFSDLFLTLKRACHHESGKVKRNGCTTLHKENTHNRPGK